MSVAKEVLVVRDKFLMKETKLLRKQMRQMSPDELEAQIEQLRSRLAEVEPQFEKEHKAYLAQCFRDREEGKLCHSSNYQEAALLGWQAQDYQYLIEFGLNLMRED